MSLGENIHRSRTEHRYSQSELAEKLGVSRQSVSKWETDSAVPDLDRLIMMSQLFGVTLDELVSDTTSDATPESTGTEGQNRPAIAGTEDGQTARGVMQPRQIVGTVLLCLAFIAIVVLMAVGGLAGLLLGLLFTSPLLVCGVICFIFKKRIGLWCGWAVFFLVDLYIRSATGVSWHLVRLTPIYEPSMNYVRLAFAWAQLTCICILLIATVLSFRRQYMAVDRKRWVILGGGWGLWALSNIPIPLPLYRVAWITVGFVLSWARLVSLAVLLVCTVCMIRSARITERAKNDQRTGDIGS